MGKTEEKMISLASLTPEQREKFVEIVSNVIAETVQNVGGTVPEGPIYAALMSVGITIEDFQTVISKLVEDSRVRRVGNHCLVATS